MESEQIVGLEAVNEDRGARKYRIRIGPHGWLRSVVREGGALLVSIEDSRRMAAVLGPDEAQAALQDVREWYPKAEIEPVPSRLMGRGKVCPVCGEWIPKKWRA